MPATKTKRKVGSKDTACRVYEYERDKEPISQKRPKEGPAVSPIHMLPGDGLVKDAARKIKKKQRREADY